MNFICKETFKYDANSNMLEKKTYWSSWGEISITTDAIKYVYDKNKNWIKKFEFLNDKPTDKTERAIEYF